MRRWFTQDPLNNADEALEFAKQYGLPIAIKAAFGGGGRGLKVAWKLEEVKELYESAVREAKAAVVVSVLSSNILINRAM